LEARQSEGGLLHEQKKSVRPSFFTLKGLYFKTTMAHARTFFTNNQLAVAYLIELRQTPFSELLEKIKEQIQCDTRNFI